MTADGPTYQTRIDRVVRWLPYATLSGSTLLVLMSRDWVPPGAAPTPVSLAVAAGVLLWMFWFITLHPGWAHSRPMMGLFFAGLLIGTTALIVCHPLFAFFAWTGYLFVSQALPGRWVILGASAVAFLGATSQIGGFAALAHPEILPIFAIVLAFNVGIGVAMTTLAAANEDESERRRTTIEELADANDRLAAALRENAGLHAQLLTQAREAGALDERQRLAGEIHDILAQGLTGIVTQLEAADAAATRPDDWQRHLGQARQLARDSLTEARRSVQALSPQPLVEAALPEALADVVDGWSTISGVSAELITTGTAHRLLPEIETTLLRTAQEALANVARHADASRVALTLSYMEDLVSLDVRDDGAGFDPDAPRTPSATGGFGLAAMRERLQRIAGTLEVESEPGSGTAISACVPAMSLRGAAA